MTNTDSNAPRPHLRLVDAADVDSSDQLGTGGAGRGREVLRPAPPTTEEPWAMINFYLSLGDFVLSSCADPDAVPRFSLSVGLRWINGHPDLVLIGPEDHYGYAHRLGTIARDGGGLSAEVLTEWDISIAPIHPAWAGSEFVEDWEEYAGRSIEEGDMIQVIPGPTWEIRPDHVPTLWEPPSATDG